MPTRQVESTGEVKGETSEVLAMDKIDIAKIPAPPTQIKNTQPNIAAKYAILVDKDTGKVLYEKNANEVVPIASTTKLASAAIVLENMNLNDQVIVKREIALTPGSTMGLKTSEKISVEKLLEGMLVVSGNDAARALADHYGSVDKFVAKMNEKAVEIGMTDSVYKDPAGYDDSGRSSARDLAIIASYNLRFPIFQEIIKKTEYDLYSDDGLVKHHLKNSNRLVNPGEPLYFPYAIGMKTGFTNDAGHCLVTAATKNNHTIVGVILNTNSTTNEASARVSRELLSWGFSNWQWE